MIKEIRISMSDILDYPVENYNVMFILKDRGFPVDVSLLTPKPKAGLKYFEFHDHKTDEIVVQWEEPLDSDSPSSVEK